MRRIIVASLAALVMVIAVPSTASAYLHVDAAHARAQSHIWNYDCPDFGGCPRWPAAVSYQRISDSRVIVEERMYNNRYGSCTGRFDIRGDDNNSSLEHYGWAPFLC